MQIRGKILSISGGVAEVCIIREKARCESCSTCPKMMGLHDIIHVAAIKGIQVGQEVVLCNNKNWLVKNKILFTVGAFVFGTILTELLSKDMSFSAHYHKEVDLLGGCLTTMILLVVLWVKRPKYLFRVELKEGRKT